ncbi:MAG: acyl carrier protein [Firmicutes bacterium]|nr:acyl carrier protein [Bacillota bacterium]
MAEIEIRVKEVLKRVLELNEEIERLRPEDSLAVLPLNSLNFVKLVVNLEFEFGIEFAEEDIEFERFQTFGELIGYIQERLSHGETDSV